MLPPHHPMLWILQDLALPTEKMNRSASLSLKGTVKNIGFILAYQMEYTENRNFRAQVMQSDYAT